MVCMYVIFLSYSSLTNCSLVQKSGLVFEDAIPAKPLINTLELIMVLITRVKYLRLCNAFAPAHVLRSKRLSNIHSMYFLVFSFNWMLSPYLKNMFIV